MLPKTKASLNIQGVCNTPLRITSLFTHYSSLLTFSSKCIQRIVNLIIFGWISQLTHKTETVMNKKLKIGLLLFLIGVVGIVTVFTIHPSTEGMLNNYSEFSVNWWLYDESLILHILRLLIAITVGTLLYDKVNFKLPILGGLVDKNRKIETSGVLRCGILGGLISGVLILLVIIAFIPILHSPLAGTWGYLKTNMVARIFDGAIRSEITNRFGLMTLLVWLMYKISGKLTPKIYWIAIVISVIPYAINNFIYTGDMMMQSKMPLMELLTLSIIYHLLLSAAGAVVFGWLYWKKGLESAIIAHVLAMVIIMVAKYGLSI